MRISYWSSDVCSSDLTGTDVSGNGFAPETGQQYEVGAKVDVIPDALSATLAVFNLTRQNVTTSDPVNDGESVATGEQRRSEERRVGKEWVRRCRSRW